MKHHFTLKTKIGAVDNEKKDTKINGFSKYCNETSLPGWAYLAQGYSKEQNIMWISLLIVICGLSAYVLVFDVQHFLESTTITSIESTTASLNDVTFPAVRVCNTNQVTFLVVHRFHF